MASMVAPGLRRLDVIKGEGVTGSSVIRSIAFLSQLTELRLDSIPLADDSYLTAIESLSRLRLLEVGIWEQSYVCKIPSPLLLSLG